MVEKIEIAVSDKQIHDENSCYERLFVLLKHIQHRGSGRNQRSKRRFEKRALPCFQWQVFAMASLCPHTPFSIHFLLCLCHRKKSLNSPKISDICHILAGKFSFNSLSNFELSLIHYDYTQKLNCILKQQNTWISKYKPKPLLRLI